jgi:trimethylamine--corrinoid protein Co-methyltransferase
MYSETPDIISFTSPFKSELLTQAELETLKGGTLRLLDEVGVHFPSRMALEIFADHGARVDMDTEIVRIPPDLVQKAMSTAPRSFVLGGREERFDLLLDGSCSYLCTDGTGVHVVDLETREMRPSRKEDVAMMARVCDALPLGRSDDGAGVRCVAPDQLLLAAGQRAGLRVDSSVAPVSRWADEHTQARARRDDSVPTVGTLRRGDGDGRGRER